MLHLLSGVSVLVCMEVFFGVCVYACVCVYVCVCVCFRRCLMVGCSSVSEQWILVCVHLLTISPLELMNFKKLVLFHWLCSDVLHVACRRTALQCQAFTPHLRTPAPCGSTTPLWQHCPTSAAATTRPRVLTISPRSSGAAWLEERNSLWSVTKI